MVLSEAAHAAFVGGTPPVPRARRSHRLPLLILLAAGLAAGAACGGSGSGSNNGVASIKTAGDKEADTEEAAKKDDTKTNPEGAMLAFARCMREHGVDMPDPDTSGGPGVVTFKAGGVASAGTKLDTDTSKFTEAHEACKNLMGDVGPMNLSPEQQQEMQDQALAFSRCMREHGINMPDPTFDGGGVMMKIDGDSGFDPSDPKFEEAQKACGSAFGPAGAKAGAGLSVGGGKVDGAKGGATGGMVIVGAGPAGGGAK
ncbi:MAG TPA: hypothetical protein VF180_12180 [Acidimicrobiia bacterium]